MTAQLEVAGTEALRVETSAGPVAALHAVPAASSVAAPVAALLLPGYTGSKEDFGPLLAPLAAAGIAVTAIDLPGQYESPGPADPAWYSTDRLGAVVVEVARVLAERIGVETVHLLGHSFGGLVARAAVLATPRRFRSLTLMCSGPAALDGPRRALIERLEPLLAAQGLAAVYAASLALSRQQPGWVEPPAPLAAFLERRFVTGAPAALAGMGRTLRREPDRVAELATVSPPALVLHGAGDDAWPIPTQTDMARRLAAELTVIPDAAHSPAIENPHATLRCLVDFWRRVD